MLIYDKITSKPRSMCIKYRKISQFLYIKQLSLVGKVMAHTSNIHWYENICVPFLYMLNLI